MRAHIAIYSTLIIFIQLAGITWAADENSIVPWPEKELEAAILGCRLAILSNAKRDYLVRNDLTESDMPSDFEARISSTIEPYLAICNCAFEVIQEEWSFPQFISRQDEVQSKMSEIIQSGQCKVDGGT